MDDPFEEHLQQLAQRARQETPPRVDTANAVRAAIAERRRPSVAPLGWVALGACAAALIVTYFSYGIIADLTDPLGTIIQTPAVYW